MLASLRCSQCHKAMPHGARYCPQCGSGKRRWPGIAIISCALLLLAGVATLRWQRHLPAGAASHVTPPPATNWSPGPDDPIIHYGDILAPPAGTLHDAAFREDIGQIRRIASRMGSVNERCSARHWTALHWAAWQDRPESTRVLIELGANVHARDTNGLTPLHLSAMRDSATSVAYMIIWGAAVDARDRWGNTPLHLAAANGHAAVAIGLLHYGATVNATDSSGLAPLHVAAPHPHMVELLLTKGADPKLRNQRGETPLQFSLRLSQGKTAETLRRHGATE